MGQLINFYGGQLPGTGTNDNAAAGNIGEFISSNVATPGAGISSATPTNITSISLTPGDWDVFGNIGIVPAGTTTVSQILAGINTVTATLPTAPGGGAFIQEQFAIAAGLAQGLFVGGTRLSLAVTTSAFLVINCTFATSTLTAFGFIGARRRR